MIIDVGSGSAVYLDDNLAIYLAALGIYRHAVTALSIS